MFRYCFTPKKKTAFCALGNFYELTLALVFTMGINDAQLCAKIIEIKNSTLGQALLIVQKQIQITKEAKQIRMDPKRPLINSILSGRPLPLRSVNFTGNPELNPCLSCGGRHKR